MARRKDVPKFGNLSGMKVVFSGISVAAPFVGELYAESGADVIWLETPAGHDVLRFTDSGYACENERRNMRTISLDYFKPEGKEIFMKIIKETDVFIEASAGGKGYTDEILWEVNPQLVITHISGYGQTGAADYVKRPGYDHTAQAFSGMMYFNGFPDRDPILVKKFEVDYYTALFAYGASLAAYINALKTGTGESIDVAQYETAVRCQCGFPSQYFHEGVQPRPEGAQNPYIAGLGYYKCQDGEGIYIVPGAGSMMKRFITLLGLEYGSELFPEGCGSLGRQTEAGKLFDDKIVELCASHTSAEAEKLLLDNNISCSRVYHYAMAEADPHYIARETYTEWMNVKGETIKGINCVPKFKNNPSRIWRGCPTIGMDTEDILADLGISDEKTVRELYDKNVVRKSDLLRYKPSSAMSK